MASTVTGHGQLNKPGGFSPADATIICPTVQPKGALVDKLKSWLASHPREIMVVTTIP